MTAVAKRRFGRARALVSLAIALLRVPLWLASPPAARRSHERAFFVRIAKGFGLSIVQHGTPSLQDGTLFIANHISWADITVLLSTLDADFVAKADMLRWPLIGTLARRFNPVFVERERQQRSHVQVDAIRARLLSGRSVILCPEGTTSDGASILPFRSSLLAAADAARIVQPIVLSYLTPEGEALMPSRLREVAWIGDDDLLSGAVRVAKFKTQARVEFLRPVNHHRDRKELAQELRQRMLEAYAAAPNRSK